MKTHVKASRLISAAAMLATASSASAAVLLTDNFSGIDPAPNTSNVNYDLAGRQTGTQETQSWTTQNNVQVGNPSVFGGTGDYLMIANFNSYAHLAGLTLNSTLVAANEKLVISFDVNVAGVTPGSWISFMISPSHPNGPAFPVVGSGDFGFLLQENGGMQAFNNGAGAAISGPAFSTFTGLGNLTFTFSGADGTGSAFAGNGTQVSIYDGTSTWTTVLNTGLTNETISFGTWGDGDRAMIDNLSITTIPEPGSTLLGGLGLLALLRRRR